MSPSSASIWRWNAAHFTAEPLYDPGEQHGVCGDDNADHGELHRRAVEERAPDVPAQSTMMFSAGPIVNHRVPSRR